MKLQNLLLRLFRSSEEAQIVSKSCPFGPKRQQKPPVPMFFPVLWRTCQRRRNSVFRPQMEGNMRHNGHFCGRIECFFVIPSK